MDEASVNVDGQTATVPTDFGAGPINKQSGEIMTEQQKLEARGALIEEKLNKQASQIAEQGDAEFNKLSAEEQEAVIGLQTVADAHYNDYINSFYAGMSKKAEDMDAVMSTKDVPPEVAEAALNDAAVEEPGLLVPDEIPGDEDGDADDGGAAVDEGEEGEMSEEDAAMLEELANELEAQGVTPEELAAAIGDVSEEGGEEVAKEAAQADARHEALKDIVRGII